MSKSSSKLKKYVGYKFYKPITDDKFEVIRIIRLEEFNDKFTIVDEEGKEKTITVGTLQANYTPLEPKGFIVVTAVWCGKRKDELKDVLVCAYDMFHAKDMREMLPYCVCRQSINDIFYDTIRTNMKQQVVGCCISKDTCPPNMNIGEMLSCNGVYKTELAHFYIDDTLESILKCVDTKYYDAILEGLFKEHMETVNKDNLLFDYSLCDLRQHDGWCRNLLTLLRENTFITDLDIMRGVQLLDFELEPHIIIDGYYLDDEINYFLAKTYKIPIDKTHVIPFDYDIDMSLFQNSAYMFFRDNTDKTYLAVFITSGQYLEAELEERYNKPSISDEIRLAFYNKYMDYDVNLIKNTGVADLRQQM